MDEVDAEEAIGRVGTTWRNRLSASDNEDSFSGGRSIMLLYKGASAQIFTKADGRVWRIRVIDGVDGRCEHQPNGRTARDFIAAIRPTLASDQVDRAASTLASALGKNGFAEVEAGGATFRSGGPCPRFLVATAL